MKVVRKSLPYILMIWPYLFMVITPFSDQEELANALLLGYCCFTLVVYGANIWNAITYRYDDALKKLAFWDMLIKLVHIPFYIFVFIMGVASLFAMVVPALILVSPFIIICLMVIDFLLMLTSSTYGICASVRLMKSDNIPKFAMILNIVLHVFFCVDIVSAIYLFIKSRKKN